MNVSEIMTVGPSYCAPDASLQEIAAMMVAEDCGQIPVCEYGTRKPIGVVTDRDIVCRTIAKGLNPLAIKVSACLSAPCITVVQDMSVDECRRLMEEHQVRRLPVIDENGDLCGIVSQADLACHDDETLTGQVVKSISQPGSPDYHGNAQSWRAA
ncbi:MAG TPA: CBS domain-containing protein [Verrucomicrobiae bacterium]|nr:CBS domain-containing protein [Verrucomicrobiae bacterium]